MHVLFGILGIVLIIGALVILAVVPLIDLISDPELEDK